MSASPRLHGYWSLPEPRLRFDASDADAWAWNPLVGLREHGPFSGRVLTGSTLRVALLAPTEQDLQALRKQLNELVHPHEARERREYLPSWPGFEHVFRAKLGPADPSAQVPLPVSLDADLKAAVDPQAHLATSLIDGLRKLTLVRDRFDVVVFYLPPRFAPLFEDRDVGFDLHDRIKSAAAQWGLTTQIITKDALTYRCRASVAWRLGTALYAKAGGTPWKLDTTQPPLDADAAYIGLSYALRTAADGRTTFVTCCSQVFDADGGGMDFIAYDVGQGEDLRNPFLSQDEMRLVMSRSLALYQDRHAGRSPSQLVVHKRTPFQDPEIAGCIDAWGAATDLHCINITSPAWRGISLDAPKRSNEKSTPSYAIARGTTFQLDDRSALVWVGGNAPLATLSQRDNYLQGKKGIPRPLLLTRDVGSGPLSDAAAQVLALTKMDWNNDALYDALPCTIQYASILARTIKNMPTLASQPYDYRFFM